MSITVDNTRKVWVEEEVTEGVYVTPSGASTALQVLKSGFEHKPAKELLERDVYTGTVGKVTPRTGQKSVTGTIPTECRAFSTEGGAPEFNSLMKSAFGARRQNTTNITTKSSGNTANTLQIEDADISKLNIGDIILVKQAGAYHMSPISARTTGTGTATVTLLVPHPSGDCADSVVIGKFTTYYMAESGHPTLSVTEFLDDAVKFMSFGNRVNKFALQNFATGKMPSLSFGFEGLGFDRDLDTPDYTPSYDTTKPPIVLDARAYIDGSAVVVNELAISMENTAGFSTGISSENGKIASRIVERKITGSIDPYQQTDSIANYTKFVNGTEFSLFAYAKNPTATPGEFENIVAVYMPKCIITELGNTNADGLVKETVSFQAGRGSAGTTNEMYVCFI